MHDVVVHVAAQQMKKRSQSGRPKTKLIHSTVEYAGDKTIAGYNVYLAVEGCVFCRKISVAISVIVQAGDAKNRTFTVLEKNKKTEPAPNFHSKPK